MPGKFVLVETPAGYGIFKVSKSLLKSSPEEIWKSFESPEAASSVVKLKAFAKFDDTTKALAAASAICENELDKGLKKFLKAQFGEEAKASLAVADSKLGSLIKDAFPQIKCIHDTAVDELLRGVRQHLDSLLDGLSPADTKAMRLGLSHSLSRFKLKMSPDKIDTMIIQAISLLDELDKELNTYAMRVREWYGWHFPEMGRIVADNIQYAKVVRKMGVRTNAVSADLSDILAEEIEKEVKTAAEVSMGTEIAEEDISNIRSLADQVISIAEYRTALFDYLKNRMSSIAPNLTIMVGELVGARLIAHAGSLVNLAKHPASTVQILGAEKALFRALKTKHDTPKYGLIYHASLVGQAAPKNKGKISRLLAAKAALATRVDALGDNPEAQEALVYKEKVESRLNELEGGKLRALSGTGKGKAAEQKYTKVAPPAKTYDTGADATMTVGDEKEEKSAKKDKKKRKIEEVVTEEAAATEESAPKKQKSKAAAEEASTEEEPKKKKKSKKDKEAAAE
jgi:nucleolar protein 58